MRNARGFTIVELLIVIVVIGILAAITIVAFNGIQERARIASGTAFAAQIKRQNLQDATGSWSFDECSGTTLNNTADGSTTPATMTSGVTWSTDTPSGSGCSLAFNGAGGTRVLTDARLSTTYYMKAAWIKMTSCSTGNNILSMPATGSPDAAMYAPGCRLQAGHNGSYGVAIMSGALSAGKWYHVAVEYVDSSLKLYVDGKVIATASSVSPPANATETGISIGSHGNGNTMTGLIDDPIIIAQ